MQLMGIIVWLEAASTIRLKTKECRNRKCRKMPKKEGAREGVGDLGLGVRGGCSGGRSEKKVEAAVIDYWRPCVGTHY